MSLIPANDPKDASRPEETPGLEDAPNLDDASNAEPSAGQDSEATPQRIPNLGHALLFLSFTGLLLVLFELLLSAMGWPPGTVRGGVTTVLHPKLQIAVEAVAYLATLAVAWFFFPRLWRRGFLDGIEWNWTTARNLAAKLVGLGVLLDVMSGLTARLITTSKPPPIDQFFSKASDAWLITFFGVVLAPVFEEICFRGFLVPAFAIAYDWLCLSRTEVARERWHSTTSLTLASLIFSAVLTSILFAWMHAPQEGYQWAALLALFIVSLVLTYVRVRTRSVAASAMVHAAYNGFLFLITMVATGGYRHMGRMMH